MLVVVPHDEVACRKQILNCTAIAAVGYVQALLNISRTEGQRKAILIAAQVKIQAERTARQGYEGLLPFVDCDL